MGASPAGSVVLVPSPFSALSRGKLRPAVVLVERIALPPRHSLRGDLDLDGHKRLPSRLAALAPQRVHVELKCAARAGDRLTSGAPIDVTARHFWHRADEAPVRLALYRHDVAELHSDSMADGAAAGNV